MVTEPLLCSGHLSNEFLLINLCSSPGLQAQLANLEHRDTEVSITTSIQSVKAQAEGRLAHSVGPLPSSNAELRGGFGWEKQDEWICRWKNLPLSAVRRGDVGAVDRGRSLSWKIGRRQETGLQIEGQEGVQVALWAWAAG